MKLIQDVPFIKMIIIYSRLSLIRISKGKIIYSNYREIRIKESCSNSNYGLKVA